MNTDVLREESEQTIKELDKKENFSPSKPPVDDSEVAFFCIERCEILNSYALAQSHAENDLLEFHEENKPEFVHHLTQYRRRASDKISSLTFPSTCISKNVKNSIVMSIP